MLFSTLSDLVIKYATGKLGLDELEGWIEPRLQTLFSPPYTDATKLAGRIQGGLAMMQDGVLSEEDYKRDLLEYVCSLKAAIEWDRPKSPNLVFGSTSEFESLDWVGTFTFTPQPSWRPEPDTHT